MLESPEQRTVVNALGFRPKNVTQDMRLTDELSANRSTRYPTCSLIYLQDLLVLTAQPLLRSDNIRYDLLRTGSVSATTNKLLERGFLDAPPPAYHTLYPPSTTANTNNNNAAAGARATTTAAAAAAAAAQKKKETLIQRYGLEERLQTAEEIKLEEVGGKAVWEDSAEKREASLRERKARMVLAARQRLLAQEAKRKEAGQSSSS
ncbi:hypothetical protein D9613_010550 [Agrocybe pediades]|uniref:Uncharacterized protein n=1 Tax=Agrocybe pediades TaxID=84607 RepID=A0A8H4VI52_9AGAR|nr:hypothetical protein D9613_010550 [Agrocybe pediades]